MFLPELTLQLYLAAECIQRPLWARVVVALPCPSGGEYRVCAEREPSLKNNSDAVNLKEDF